MWLTRSSSSKMLVPLYFALNMYSLSRYILPDHLPCAGPSVAGYSGGQDSQGPRAQPEEGDSKGAHEDA